MRSVIVFFVVLCQLDLLFPMDITEILPPWEWIVWLFLELVWIEKEMISITTMLTWWIISRAGTHLRNELTFGVDHLLFVEHLIPPPVCLVAISDGGDDDQDPISIQGKLWSANVPAAAAQLLILEVKVELDPPSCLLTIPHTLGNTKGRCTY